MPFFKTIIYVKFLAIFDIQMAIFRRSILTSLRCSRHLPPNEGDHTVCKVVYGGVQLHTQHKASEATQHPCQLRFHVIQQVINQCVGEVDNHSRTYCSDNLPSRGFEDIHVRAWVIEQNTHHVTPREHQRRDVTHENCLRTDHIPDRLSNSHAVTKETKRHLSKF